ncbi:hypothetical protein [Kribbella speibonae]|uniref:Uncharacterized protein n=1 Tax=Kribbella speibonae TaxID=1572660 RepID=A0ABY2A4Q2_9ACTN|nr:hypothetical protein [Kribbella speibonae]TCC23510.1 hypothetical protein E0H58_17200 [Kribbella speibonae]
MSDANQSPALAQSTDAPGWTVKARPVVDVSSRILCLVIGGGLLVGGLVGLFTEVGEGQLITVVAAGLVLLVMPSIVDRVRSMRLGQFEVHLVRQIAATARKSAETLRRLGMESQLDAYATIYTELRDPELKAVRGEILDRIVQRVANASAVEKFDKDEVKNMYLNGSPIVRVLALGLMEGDLSLIDGEVLRTAIDKSLTGNEQLHALKVIRRGWGQLTTDQQQELRQAIDANQFIKDGPDRRAVAEKIRELDESPRIR